MTKIQIASDLHVDIIRTNYCKIMNGKWLIPSADILVIAGDISEDKWRHTLSGKAFFEYLYDNWKYIVEVRGNHDVWGTTYHRDNMMFYDVNTEVKEGKHWILNNNMIRLEGVNFYGTTLWSNIPINKVDNISRYMNDYARTEHFTPNDSHNIFKYSLDWLIDSLNCNSDKESKDVIITHHLPSFELIDDIYVGNKANNAYASSLDASVLSQFDIDLWVHGHCHTFIDKKIEGVRCVRNPLGYGSPYDKPCFIHDFVIEV